MLRSVAPRFEGVGGGTYGCAVTASANIRELLVESRRFPAPPHIAATANVGPDAWDEAAADPLAFWERAAARLEWAEPWHTTHTWQPALQPDGSLQPPRAEWFAGGRLNVAVNCVDRHVASGFGDRVAYHFEGEQGDTRTLSYAELQREVSKAANALTELGSSPGTASSSTCR